MRQPRPTTSLLQRTLLPQHKSLLSNKLLRSSRPRSNEHQRRLLRWSNVQQVQSHLWLPITVCFVRWNREHHTRRYSCYGYLLLLRQPVHQSKTVCWFSFEDHRLLPPSRLQLNKSQLRCKFGIEKILHSSRQAMEGAFRTIFQSFTFLDLFHRKLFILDWRYLLLIKNLSSFSSLSSSPFPPLSRHWPHLHSMLIDISVFISTATSITGILTPRLSLLSSASSRTTGIIHV